MSFQRIYMNSLRQLIRRHRKQMSVAYIICRELEFRVFKYTHTKYD